MHERQRQANLLGAASTAVADQMVATTTAIAPNAGEGPAGLVALATFLDGGSIEDLRTVLGLSHSATVRLVDKLERDGMVRRRPGHDGRTVALVATAKGSKRATEIQRARLDAVSQLLDPLSAREREELCRLHEKLLAGVVASGESRGRICRLCHADVCGHDRGRCPVTEAPEPGSTGS